MHKGTIRLNLPALLLTTLTSQVLSLSFHCYGKVLLLLGSKYFSGYVCKIKSVQGVFFIMAFNHFKPSFVSIP